MRHLNELRWRFACLRWALQMPRAAMDPSLLRGEDLSQQERTLIDRHDAKRPRREDYGLSDRTY